MTSDLQLRKFMYDDKKFLTIESVLIQPTSCGSEMWLAWPFQQQKGQPSFVACERWQVPFYDKTFVTTANDLNRPTNEMWPAWPLHISAKRFIDVFCEAQFSTRYVPWQVVFRKGIWNYVGPIIPFPGLSWAFFFAETDLSVCIRKVLYLQLNSNEIWRLIFRCRSWWPIYVH